MTIASERRLRVPALTPIPYPLASYYEAYPRLQDEPPIERSNLLRLPALTVASLRYVSPRRQRSAPDDTRPGYGGVNSARGLAKPSHDRLGGGDRAARALLAHFASARVPARSPAFPQRPASRIRPHRFNRGSGLCAVLRGCRRRERLATIPRCAARRGSGNVRTFAFRTVAALSPADRSCREVE